MEMRVKHGLSRVGAGVEHGSVAGVGHSFGARELRGHAVQVPYQRVVLGGEVAHRRDVFFRYDKNVGRRLRVEVADGERVIVFVNLFRGDLSVADFAKQAVAHAAIFRAAHPGSQET